jgi:hypothetical protein
MRAILPPESPCLKVVSYRVRSCLREPLGHSLGVSSYQRLSCEWKNKEQQNQNFWSGFPSEGKTPTKKQEPPDCPVMFFFCLHRTMPYKSLGLFRSSFSWERLLLYGFLRHKEIARQKERRD